MDKPKNVKFGCMEKIWEGCVESSEENFMVRSTERLSTAICAQPTPVSAETLNNYLGKVTKSMQDAFNKMQREAEEAIRTGKEEKYTQQRSQWKNQNLQKARRHQREADGRQPDELLRKTMMDLCLHQTMNRCLQLEKEKEGEKIGMRGAARASYERRKNHEGYSDPTASAAVGRVSKKEKKKRKKTGRSSSGRRKNSGKSN